MTGGELFEDIVAREYYSEADARYDTHIVCHCAIIITHAEVTEQNCPTPNTKYQCLFPLDLTSGPMHG